MHPTNVGNPNYYHRVVDCEWACPAHTNVPEYIRLIAQGRYTEAYLVNRESNVFPGILGRTCDRPCEPACRRGRVDGKPVAICRLKRVAADMRDDVRGLPPEVLDEETAYIIDMGVDVRYDTPVTSMRALLAEGHDAVFVGSGAPKGKELDLPGRRDTDRIHIGIEWLANVHFGHVESIGERVLIIGVGNTAMDCCRTARRVGGKDLKVIST